MVEEVTGELISDSHAKSELVGILDPMTRQHTAMHHGGNTGYEKLKRVVLEFTNNVAGSDSAMQVDQPGQEHTGADPAAWTRPGTGEQYVSAFDKGASQCYKCQGYGARAVEKKGIGEENEMEWLVKDMSEEMKSWGHQGGDGGHIILKSDGEVDRGFEDGIREVPWEEGRA